MSNPEQQIASTENPQNIERGAQPGNEAYKN